MSSPVFNILIIEDDLSEQKLIKMMAKNSPYDIHFRFIDNGEEALEFIESYTEEQAAVERISLVLLDLNLPRVKGIELLKTIKQNKFLNRVPVVILTTSNNIVDITSAYESGASGYIRKPSIIDEYENTINGLFNYWFGLCLIP